MDPNQLFFDDRFRGNCSHCGRLAESFDHAPSKVFLDKPYPNNLPGVESCQACNNSFSLDEEYVACFIECVLAGSVLPERLQRAQIAKILTRKPSIASLIKSSCSSDSDGTLMWSVDMARVQNVMLKLGRGHVAYEMCEPKLLEPSRITTVPLCVMSDTELNAFEFSATNDLWPEIGSRAFLRACGGGYSQFTTDSWEVIQPARYRYRVFYDRDGGLVSQVVLREYLACEIAWE